MENNNPYDDPILRRAYLFLEDGDFENAYIYADKALDVEPENYRAYLCKLLCTLRIKEESLLKYTTVDFSDSSDYKNALKFANQEQTAYLKHALDCASKSQKDIENAKAATNEIKHARWLIEDKIKDEQNTINSCYNRKADNAENKKFKILGGLYLIFLLSFWGGFALLFLGNDFIILFAVLFALGFIGMWTLHSVLCYIDETTDSKFYAFGFGVFNTWSLGIWGLVKSIKKLVRRNSVSNAELDKTIRECNQRKAQYEKDLKEFDEKNKI